MARGMVAFGEDWGGLPSSTQHIVGRLARDRDVVWINSIGMRRPRLDARDFARVVAKASALARRGGSRSAPAAATPERLSIVRPMAVSWPGATKIAILVRTETT